MEERVQLDPGGVVALGLQQGGVCLPRPRAGAVMTPGWRLTGLRVAGDPPMVTIIAGVDLLHGHLVTRLTAVTYHSPLPRLLRCGDESAVTIPRLQVKELSLGSSVSVRNARDVNIIIATELADDDESDGGHDEEN